MNIIFEFSKEYKNLSFYEVISLLEMEEINYKIIESNQDLLIISGNFNHEKINQIGNRLSLTYNIGELLFYSKKSIQEIKKKSLKIKIKNYGSIAIKYRRRGDEINSQKIVKALADIFARNRKVDLINPKIEIRCLITNDKIYVSRNFYRIDRKQFEKRKVQFRPFFSPISLHPKLSRVMINLSMVKKNETLLDPFCGTGGILIEAGIIGIEIIGNDIDKKLVNGCKENLNYYNINNFKIFNLDIENIINKLSNVDAVVSDFPYGKSTTTNGEDLENLYKRAFKSIHSILKSDRRAVIGLANKNMIGLGEKYFLLEKIFDIKVHNSLTRYFVVYKKN